jgi:chorismate synthase
MSGNTFGTIFRITTWGESHGRAVGVVVDGCPAGLDLAAEDIQKELDRRRPGRKGSTRARRIDETLLASLIKTTGTPISMIVGNRCCPRPGLWKTRPVAVMLF